MSTVDAIRAAGVLATQRGWLAPSVARFVRPDMDVYEPKQASRATTIVFHGLHPLGPRDPRVARLAAGLAGAGYRAVVPRIDSLSELRLSPRLVTEFAQRIRAVQDDATLRTGAKVGVVSAGFAGGLALSAAAQPEARDRISAVCAVGSFSNLRDTVDGLVRRRDPADPSWKSIIASFLSQSMPEQAALAHVLRMSAREDILRPRTSTWGDAAAQLGVKPIATRIMNDPLERLRVWMTLRRKLRRSLMRLNLTSQLHAIRASVVLVHGEHDRVIQLQESASLYQSLASQGKDATLFPHRMRGNGLDSLRGDVRRSTPAVRGLARWLEAVAR